MFIYVFINLVQLAGIVNPAVPECRLQQNGSSYFYNGTIIYVRTYVYIMQHILCYVYVCVE